jgi:hypothetical protein
VLGQTLSHKYQYFLREIVGVDNADSGRNSVRSQVDRFEVFDDLRTFTATGGACRHQKIVIFFERILLDCWKREKREGV